jgi:hypothetical protein
MAQVTINNGDSGSTVRTALNGMFTELYGESNFPQVADYASLPVASSFSGATYEVLASTGTFLVNRKSAGLYRSNGTTWVYLGDINTDAATTGNTPAGNISATTVQAAINELDTEKAIAGAVTSSGLTMATGKLLGRSTASTGAIEELSTVPAANFPALTGDITTAGGALATTIGAGKVTLAMQANMATASLVYRKTAGSGAPEVNTLATLKTDLGLTGTNGGDQTITLTGDVTGSGTGSFAATIASSAVTLAKIANARQAQRSSVPGLRVPARPMSSCPSALRCPSRERRFRSPRFRTPSRSTSPEGPQRAPRSTARRQRRSIIRPLAHCPTRRAFSRYRQPQRSRPPLATIRSISRRWRRRANC